MRIKGGKDPNATHYPGDFNRDRAVDRTVAPEPRPLVSETTKVTEYAHPARDFPHTVRGDLLITTVRVEEGPGHDYVHVWNRGGKAGTLTVTKGDGHVIARRILPSQPTP